MEGPRTESQTDRKRFESVFVGALVRIFKGVQNCSEREQFFSFLNDFGNAIKTGVEHGVTEGVNLQPDEVTELALRLAKEPSSKARAKILLDTFEYKCLLEEEFLEKLRKIKS